MYPTFLGYDVIAKAQSGTGKTATFAISILQQLEIEVQGDPSTSIGPHQRTGSTGIDSVDEKNCLRVA